MREWLSGGVSPCQGEGRGFESRLALFLLPGGSSEELPFCVCGRKFGRTSFSGCMKDFGKNPYEFHVKELFFYCGMKLIECFMQLFHVVCPFLIFDMKFYQQFVLDFMSNGSF